MAAHPTTHDRAHEHAHVSTGVYVRIGIVLFILTALEVAAYEVAHGDSTTGFGAVVAPALIPILLVLSAAKFLMVAMYYMHLKQDAKVLSGVFIFSLVIAALMIVGFILLFSYHWHFAQPFKLPG